MLCASALLLALSMNKTDVSLLSTSSVEVMLIGAAIFSTWFPNVYACAIVARLSLSLSYAYLKEECARCADARAQERERDEILALLSVLRVFDRLYLSV